MGQRAQIRTAVRVERPAEQVFDYLVDVTKHADWSPKPYRAEGVTLPLAVGSTFNSIGWIPGDKDHHNHVEVTVVDPPKRFVLTSTEKGEQFINTFTLTPDGNATNVERVIDMPKPGGFVGVIFPLAAAGFVKPAVQKGLNMLKSRLESA
jgi:uncharacterized protein YndB with AHSA1/START domain